MQREQYHEKGYDGKEGNDYSHGEPIPFAGHEAEVVEPKLSEETKRELKPRQISMIAIGGAIGTGLVIGSGSSLSRSGPASLFISYVIMGIVSFLSL
jgi:amino acid transporter